MELKLPRLADGRTAGGFNRTFMELKCYAVQEKKVWISSFNRTFMELK